MIETTIRTDAEVVTISKEHYKKAIVNMCKIAQIERMAVQKYRETDEQFRDIATVRLDALLDILGIDRAEIEVPNVFKGV